MDTYLEFASNHTLLVLGLVASFFLLIFSELRRKAQGTINLEPQDAVTLINDDAAVIDIRAQDAFARGHIVHAQNIPMADLEARHDALEKLKEKPILLVCDHGNTSTKAVMTLRKTGFASAFGLKGGLTAWTQAGLPLVGGKKKQKQKKK